MARDDTSKTTSVASTPVEDPSETTPLLPTRSNDPHRIWHNSVVLRVLFTGFIVSMSFGVTQVPIIDVFRIMTCEEYYKTHSEPAPGTDRCKLHAIEAGRAQWLAILSIGTSAFGLMNLFVTGWMIKAFGVKRALLISVFWPAIRLAVQNVGVMTGAREGMIIMVCSQFMTIVGGPAGYMLALNSFAADVVEPVERTPTLGRLAGCNMMGAALGMLAGGLISDAFGIIVPFRVTFLMFLGSSIYVILALPYMPINKLAAAKASRSIGAFFEPLKMFTPPKWVTPSGKVHREYGVTLLGLGAFLGVLATGYILTLLQMYSNDAFDFTTSNNGWLIFVNASVRGLFLSLAFPRIIHAGRKWHNARQAHAAKVKVEPSDVPTLPTTANGLAEVPGPVVETEEPTEPPKPEAEQESFAFDLLFTRYSLLADGILTGAAYFTAKGWELYIVAVAVSLASGTGSAAKGTMLQMCSPEQRADALSAISLIESMARMSTFALFGFIYSAFSSIGRPNLTFACNAGVAILGFLVLLFARFPPEGSIRFVKSTQEERDADHETPADDR